MSSNSRLQSGNTDSSVPGSSAAQPESAPVLPGAYVPPEDVNKLPPLEAAPPRPWWMDSKDDTHSPKACAVAYYRHSAQDKQKNSIPIQAERVRAYAKKQGLRNIHELSDRGRPSPGLPELMKMTKWIDECKDFAHVLLLVIRRQGRFEDTDLSVKYELVCREAGKRVHYMDLRDLNMTEWLAP